MATWNRNTKIRSALRNVWRFSPMRQAALRAARVGYGRYECALCKGTFSPRDVAVDHVEPCGTIDDVTSFVARLFCDSSGLQILCKAKCHAAKTKAEREARKAKRVSRAK
jgi:hypothetical protein